jgi:cob(I)alamin adenosyltransferase
MVRLNKIYTRTGDDGSTGLVDGTRVAKNDPRVVAYGTVDELCTHLGMCRSLLSADELGVTVEGQALDGLLEQVQQQLFDLGSLLAAPYPCDFKLPPITDVHVSALERALDAHNENLEALTSFVLPGGHLVAAQIHLARVVCRRAERLCVGLDGVDVPEQRILQYLNRLSDLCFVLARWVNHSAGVPEPLWTPGSGPSE